MLALEEVVPHQGHQHPRQAQRGGQHRVLPVDGDLHKLQEAGDWGLGLGGLNVV